MIMTKVKEVTNQLQIVAGSMDKIVDRVNLIDEAKVLNEQLKASNATLQPEEKATILENFINSSSNLKVVDKKDGTRVIAGNWVVGFNVASVTSGKWVGVIKAFDKDANVVFQAYGSNATVKLGKLTADWVKRVAKIEA